MRAPRFFRFGIATLALLLQACAAAPEVGEPVAVTPPGVGEPSAVTPPRPVPQPVPELNLNLEPQGHGYAQPSVVCTPSDEVDYTFFDKGFSSLVAGDHTEAIRYFQRYRRMESSAAAQWEADIAMAYDSMLPQSPFYDPQGARKAYYRLDEQQPSGGSFHEKSLFMRDALATFVLLKMQINELQNDNASLSEELDKLEEALRRLRELTLGQKGATP